MEIIKTSHISAMRNCQKNQKNVPAFLSPKATENAYRIHRELAEYCPTPLVSLEALAKELGMKALLVKDESKRFGLNAFKGLGAIYALTMMICQQLNLDPQKTTFEDLKNPMHSDKIHKMIFVTATDGNHGRGIAWAADQLGCEAHIYMPVGSSIERANAIRTVNPKATVKILDVGYDEAVIYAAKQASENGWFLTQDTSWDGYEQIPIWIIQGYTTMIREAIQQTSDIGLSPTHIFLQAGVGAMAGAVTGYLANIKIEKRPCICVVEPENVACIYASAFANDSAPHKVLSPGSTIMAGLNCAEPCTVTWPILRDHGDWYMKVPDKITKKGMQILANGAGNDQAIISGESGAVTIGFVQQLVVCPAYKELKEKLNITEDSVILCFNTEGDTDSENYRRIIEETLLFFD